MSMENGNEMIAALSLRLNQADIRFWLLKVTRQRSHKGRVELAGVLRTTLYTSRTFYALRRIGFG